MTRQVAKCPVPIVDDLNVGSDLLVITVLEYAEGKASDLPPAVLTRFYLKSLIIC